MISDHYHPWLPEQSHSPFAWTMLGAVAQATERIELATMVTCPIIRYHPAIVAQMAATVAVISNGRFTLGLGAGERLNEHVVGQGWPPADVRHEMLAEALKIINRLWRGGFVSHRGRYYTVEDAQVFDLPAEPIPTYLAAGGPRPQPSRRVLRVACASPSPTRPSSAPTGMPAVTVGCGDRSFSAGIPTRTPRWRRRTASSGSRTAAGRYRPSSQIPSASTPPHRRSLPRTSPTGSRVAPTPRSTAAGMASFIDVGVENLAVAYPGDDWRGFMRFWQTELA